ncbi:hypothetical protein [Flexivirga caeni]|uniref:Uncharacterized protein n=1 Tax=Flexivirga caeni TaxID=2294115 RepID=A0A3M9MGW8_9MICO|nr:hypothetical protein [Flexivirga caeni]RNI24799.1 hypothetical protein EFY87_03670 [Flexivirga caeni]
MSPSVVTLTYAPAAGVDVEHLVAVAAAIRGIFDSGPLYEDVRIIGDTVRFTVRFARWPEYGAANLARGLVGRALSEAGVAGRLVEVACAET